MDRRMLWEVIFGTLLSVFMVNQMRSSCSQITIWVNPLNLDAEIKLENLKTRIEYLDVQPLELTFLIRKRGLLLTIMYIICYNF